jgi:iron complex transport system substrate-binding protein
MKIVSLLPSATEILCALGLEESLVAVSHECDFPPSVKALPKATSSRIPHGLKPEEIDQRVREAKKAGLPLYVVDGDLLGELEPDLIVTQGLCDVCAVTPETVDAALAELPAEALAGARILALGGTSIEGVFADIEAVAEVCEIEERARPILSDLRQRWSRLESSEPEQRPRVFMLEWPEPAWIGGHWVPEQVEAAGGTDVLGLPGEKSRSVSWDEVEAADPDIICVMACGFDLENNSAFARSLQLHHRARNLRAVRSGQLFALDANRYFSRPAPGLVEGAELLRGILQSGQEVAEKVCRIQPSPRLQGES